MLASLFIVLGVQIFALGLLGELIIFAHAGGNKDYKVERITQFPNAPLATYSKDASSKALEMSQA